MRRRAVLKGMAASAGILMSQSLRVLADPPIKADPTDPPPSDPPPAPAAPVRTSAPAAPASKPDDGKPDYSDPKYSPNAYSPIKQVIDGPPQPGDKALTSDDLNLRANPSTNSDVQVVMPTGSMVTIESKPKDGYFPVNFQSTMGWADSKYLQRLAPEMPPVIGVGNLLESTPIFDAPDTNGKQVASWRAGIPLSWYAEMDGAPYKGSKRWYKVLANPDRFVSTWTVFGTATAGLQSPPALPASGPLASLGQVQSDANIRSGPGPSHDIVKTWYAGRRVIVYNEVKGETYNGSTSWYQIAVPPEQSLFVHASFIKKLSDITRVDKPAFPGRWIDIDLDKQVLVAYYAERPLLVAQTASGTNAHATDKGTWGTFWRLTAQRMQGDNRFSNDYYNLDAVPYISYFHPSGEAIHGTYWHDNFGTQMSHGCVNTSIVTSQWVLNWAPLGTKVVVH
jgi:lipoprotein-anchoring transpeptidase ErfK/SrfK